jgi:hypothetical protein
VTPAGRRLDARLYRVATVALLGFLLSVQALVVSTNLR